MLCKVTHYTAHVLPNVRPHQMHWGDCMTARELLSRAHNEVLNEERSANQRSPRGGLGRGVQTMSSPYSTKSNTVQMYLKSVSGLGCYSHCFLLQMKERRSMEVTRPNTLSPAPSPAAE